MKETYEKALRDEPRLRLSRRQIRTIRKFSVEVISDIVRKVADEKIQTYDLLPLLCAQITQIEIEKSQQSEFLFNQSQRQLPIISRDKVPHWIWAEQNGLRYIIPIAAMWAGFWTPYRILDRERFLVEQQRRNRIGNIKDRTPVWAGEPRPANYDHVSIEELLHSLSSQELKELRKLGFPPGAFPHSSLKDFSLLCDYILTSDCYKRPPRTKPEPNPAPEFTTPNSDGWTGVQVARVIGEHHWDEPTANAVFAAVYEREKLSAAAEKYQVPRKTLSQYVWLTRKDLRPLNSAPPRE